MLKQHQGNSIPYNYRLAPLLIRDTLYALIPDGTEHICVTGIGSNVISGDSLGPFVGTLLRDSFPTHLTVYGNLQTPLDGTTIEKEISRFNLPSNCFVIGIDSVLGSESLLNSIVISNSALHPGAGLGKNLPCIGDCSVMGVVLEKHTPDHTSLLYTDLHVIYTMAVNIAKAISLLVRQYFRYPADHPILQVR
ncbi:spore protease YyaC [Bacillus dakarensis]|uniref:spore protease YyaC n=1 Tax=Robertmurraya dakarensis TaxID=1926278 RepID=UPI000980CAD1|nr:spore protease YyaC [Bacillus dakarensis]